MLSLCEHLDSIYSIDTKTDRTNYAWPADLTQEGKPDSDKPQIHRPRYLCGELGFCGRGTALPRGRSNQNTNCLDRKGYSSYPEQRVHR